MPILLRESSKHGLSLLCQHHINCPANAFTQGSLSAAIGSVMKMLGLVVTRYVHLVFSILLLMQQFLKSLCSFNNFVLLYMCYLHISFSGELFLCRSRGAETSTCEVGSLQEVSYYILHCVNPVFIHYILII